MWLRFAIAGLLLIAASCHGKNYAVLVAGSYGWGNYRHQSDICHAYQVLKNRGFEMENIITLMYDDIAYNANNPMQGKIINQPYGPNVYEGVIIDYSREELNSANFLHILNGNATALRGIGSGRVLQSGSEDIVFINFVDHGGVGLLCFPNENLFADDLENTLRNMAKNKQFKKLLIYIDACESGSMFDNLLSEYDNILVSTAAARDESSVGWYCLNPQINTCLGDLYSITWLQQMDHLLGTELGNNETLWNQYNYVRTQVLKSHVQLYGEINLGLDTLELYFGSTPVTDQKVTAPVVFMENTVVVEKGVPNRDVEIHTARRMVTNSPPHLRQERENHLNEMLQNREHADQIMAHIFKLVSKGNNKMYNNILESKFQLNKINYPCYKNLVNQFNQVCYNTAKNSYFLKYLNKLVNICSLKEISQAEAIEAMKTACYLKPRITKNIV